VSNREISFGTKSRGFSVFTVYNFATQRSVSF
jgi:hypothetical protein